jgi:DNA invertase Pin-like site-specific DNA recombinase
MSSTAIYLRVSTHDQTLASQRPDVERWCAAHDSEAEYFCDASSGRSMDRPDWLKLIEEIRAGRVNRLVVWRLDRLGRTAAGLTALFEELQAHGCTLVSIREGIDLSTPAGRLMANVIASVAAYETEVRRERVAAGIAAAKAAGKVWGGRKKGSLNRHTAKQLTAIVKGFRQGIPVAALARIHQLSVNTIKNILRTTED